MYCKIAAARPFEGAPQIHSASVYGASPGKPILYRIPVTGQRPITYRAEGLPDGLRLEGSCIRGAVEKEGLYPVTLFAENALGEAKRTLTFEIRPGAVLLTPLMGFTTWNAFGFAVKQADVERTAEQMLEAGLCEYGYRYMNIDSGWQDAYGGDFDATQPRPDKFTDMGAMCTRLHGMGFLCGISSSPMLVPYGCRIDHVPAPTGTTQGEPDIRFADERGGIGTIRKEKNNALQWAAWGFDYLKYDWRPSDPYNAELMRSELVKTDRDFGFCVTIRAYPAYHRYWETYCSSYRCGPDSKGTWKALLGIYNSYQDFVPYVNRGHFYDFDMLDIGDCGLFLKHPKDYVYRGFTEDEQVVSYSLRAFFASPIQISARLDALSDFERDLYCNDEVIAINQDAAFDAAKPYSLLTEGERMLHIWKRRLENGDEAWAIFNLGETEETASVDLDAARVRDVWAKEDVEGISCTLPPHTARLFRVTRKSEREE